MVSRFATQFNALAFAYGCSGPGTPAPLMVNVGNAAAGASSLALDNSYTVTEDGILFYPLATTAPAVFGQGANAETLTPSAVFDSNIYGVGTVMATFANLHGQGDTISSSTYGLQEAINYANTVSGGVVVVGSRWSTLGGTSAMIAAATVPTKVSIQDDRGGGVTQENTATVALTNANMLALNGTPIAVIPAQGAGSLIEIVSMVFDAKFKTAAFTGG